MEKHNLKKWIKELDMGTPVWLREDKVLMTHLEGSTVENMKDKGVHIFRGKMGKMKPTKKVRKHEIERLLREGGRLR